jgi:hypothetical protein
MTTWCITSKASSNYKTFTGARGRGLPIYICTTIYMKSSNPAQVNRAYLNHRFLRSTNTLLTEVNTLTNSLLRRFKKLTKEESAKEWASLAHFSGLYGKQTMIWMTSDRNYGTRQAGRCTESEDKSESEWFTGQDVHSQFFRPV